MRNKRFQAKQDSPSSLREPTRTHIVFSFRQIDCHSNEKFKVVDTPDGYVVPFLERLRELCRMTALDFKSNRSPALRAHPVDFGRTSERDGARFFDSLQTGSGAPIEPYQFSVSANKYGRGIGFPHFGHVSAFGDASTPHTLHVVSLISFSCSNSSAFMTFRKCKCCNVL